MASADTREVEPERHQRVTCGFILFNKASVCLQTKLGRFDHKLAALRIDQKGNVTEQAASFRDMLQHADIYVSNVSITRMMFRNPSQELTARSAHTVVVSSSCYSHFAVENRLGT
jgi:hypothetical protein